MEACLWRRNQIRPGGPAWNGNPEGTGLSTAKGEAFGWSLRVAWPLPAPAGQWPKMGRRVWKSGTASCRRRVCKTPSFRRHPLSVWSMVHAGGMEGVLSAATTAAVEGRLAEPLRDSGSLMFWFRTDRAYRTGTACGTLPNSADRASRSGDRFFSSGEANRDDAGRVGWRSEIMKTRHIRIQLPEFPGPEWHHFALVWHRKNGETNAYLDGTPYFIPGKNIQPLPVPDAAAVRVPLGRIALADVRIGAHVFVAEELPGSLGADARRLDRLIGAAELPAFPARDSRGPLLFESRLAETGDIAAWKLEGPGEITFADGWMEMRSARPEGPEGHFVLWAPAEFPTDFQAEWNSKFCKRKAFASSSSAHEAAPARMFLIRRLPRAMAFFFAIHSR